MLVAGVVTTAQAANWQLQGKHTDGVITIIDTDSLIFDDNTRTSRSAWLKMINPNGSYDLHRVDVNCPTRMMRFLITHQYSNSGYIYKSILQPSAWEYTVPASYGETWTNTICLTNARSR